MKNYSRSHSILDVISNIKKLACSANIGLLILVSPLSGLQSQNKVLEDSTPITESSLTATASRRLLKLPSQQAIQEIKKMTAKQADRYISEIRFLVRKDNPDLDRVYLILRHLESLKATALSQKRLNNLLWVIAISLFLFSSFLFYIYLNQRSVLKHLEKEGQKEKKEQVPKTIYRGETS